MNAKDKLQKQNRIVQLELDIQALKIASKSTDQLWVERQIERLIYEMTQVLEKAKEDLKTQERLQFERIFEQLKALDVTQ